MEKETLAIFAQELINYQIAWENSSDVNFPWKAEVFSHQCKIRLNDFPDEPAYTLFIDEEEMRNLESWPKLWTRSPR